MAKDVGWQQDDCLNETESPFHGDAGEAEWKQKEPHNGIQNQGCKCKRPAEKKKYEPKKKFRHVTPLFLHYGSSPHRLRFMVPHPIFTR